MPQSHDVASLELLGGDVEVVLAGGRKLPYANLDYAASAPCARVAADAVADLLPSYSSVHRGAGALSRLCTLRFEQARESVKEFLGCRDDDAVVFTRNTTDALNLLAHCVPPHTTVVTFAAEHHANLLPWRRVVRLPAPSSAAEAVRAVDGALQVLRPDAAALVCVTGASNVSGELLPIDTLARVAHRHGARIAVDAAQLVAHAAVNVAELDLDYVAFSGHKVYAPFGSGVLAGRPDWLDAAPPYLLGGGASVHVGDATHDVRWHTGAARHEAGTPNLLGAVALAAVCDALVRADRSALAAHEATLLQRLRSGLGSVVGVRELAAFGPEHPRVGIVSFVVDGVAAADVSARLAQEHGIGVRDGLFCAHPFTRRLVHQAGGTGAAVRASFGLGTADTDIDRLVAGVRAIAANPR